MADFDLERILDAARKLSRDQLSIFERPLGTGEECLSARQLVGYLQAGAPQEEIGHLVRCSVCRESLAGLAGVHLESGREFVVNALRIVGQQNTKRNILKKGLEIIKSIDIGEIFRGPRPLPAFIALKDTVLQVSDPLATDLTLSCDLIPTIGLNLLGKIKRDSLRVEGALLAKKIYVAEPIDLDQDGQPDLLRITFTGGHLASRVRKAIQQRQSVVDTICLKGQFEGLGKQSFLATARLEFRASSKPITTG